MDQASSAQIIGKTQAPAYKHSVSCADCMLQGSCFPIDMGAPKVVDFNAIVQRTRPLHKGDHIYRSEQPFATVYVVRSGAFKAYTVSPEGEEQVVQFYLPGEIFGMDGLSRNRYAMSVVALETSSVCAIPFERLQALSMHTPGLQRHFFRIMSDVIIREQDLITQLSKHTAERRIATFLQRISKHQAGRRQSATRIRLPMSRTDIGCHLGLTVETVSRIFSRFQKIGLLAANNRDVEILRLDWLEKFAAGQPLVIDTQAANISRGRPALASASSARRRMQTTAAIDAVAV